MPIEFKFCMHDKLSGERLILCCGYLSLLLNSNGVLLTLTDDCKVNTWNLSFKKYQALYLAYHLCLYNLAPPYTTNTVLCKVVLSP